MSDERPEILDPWDRRANESDEAFEAFAAYRDLGPSRSQRAAAERLGKTRQLLSGWSSKHDWTDRAGAWDLEQDRIRREAMARENANAARRQAQSAQGSTAAMMVPITEVLRRVQENPEIVKGMKFEDLFDLAIRAARVVPRTVVAERLARGQTTENAELTTTTTVHHERAERMSDAQLDEFLEGRLAPAQLPPGDD